MCEDVSEVDLIDVMGEASRDESTAIAQRLAAVGELYARRAVEVGVPLSSEDSNCSSHVRAARQAKRTFAETHLYVEVTAKRCHSPGTPLSS
jgi:hypothetical protein